MNGGHSNEQFTYPDELENSADSEGLRCLMKLLASFYGVTVATVMKYNARGVEVIAGTGLLEVKLQAGLGMDAFLKHGDFVCPDAMVDSRFNSLRVVTGIWGLRLVVVRNLICEISGDSYFLLLADSKPRNPEDAPKLDDLRDAAQLACAKLHITRIIRTIQALTPEFNANAKILARLFDDVVFPVVATSPDLDILSVNEAARPYVAVPDGDIDGKTLRDMFPVHYKAFEEMGRTIFSKKALRQIIEVEFTNPHNNDAIEYLKITFFPLLNSRGEIFMIAGIACDVTLARRIEQNLKSNPKFSTKGFQEAFEINSATSNPVIRFLLDTLVEQRALRSRNEVSYLTVRTWRKPIKSYQVKALKALKGTDPETCAAVISEEMLGVISSMVGTKAFDGIVAIPCGHSSGGICLSTMIADILSARTGLPVVRAFEPRPLKGSSHPKASARMPALKLREKPAGNMLLVDDVVTSGRHLEEAVELLRGKGADVMAIAWIGGEKA